MKSFNDNRNQYVSDCGTSGNYEHGNYQELETLRIEYSNVFDRSNKLDNKVYIIITFCGFLFVFITGLFSSFVNISFSTNGVKNLLTVIYIITGLAVIISYVFILIYLMKLLEPEGIKRMDPILFEDLKLSSLPEDQAIAELVQLYRDVININLEKLHIRCDKLNVGLRYVVLTVILSFVSYSIKIILGLV